MLICWIEFSSCEVQAFDPDLIKQHVQEILLELSLLKVESNVNLKILTMKIKN